MVVNLTENEDDVFDLLAMGYTPREASVFLNKTVGCVENIIRSVRAKSNTNCCLYSIGLYMRARSDGHKRGVYVYDEKDYL
jgi:DNA-binding CsgD family transcriptional regulator